MAAVVSRPLEGTRVVELGAYVSAPFCSRLLADLGAEVVKVEPPPGDPARGWGPFAGDHPDPEGSGLFTWLNAGKQGVTADLDGSDDRAWFEEVLAGCDVLVENLAPDARRRWGLEFDGLAARHPHLVAVSLSPYGRTGAWADRPGTDLTAAALASLPLGLGEPDREPLRLPFEQSDLQAGLHGAAAALCALWERRRSGQGQGIDVATAQVMAYCVGGMYLVTAKVGTPWGRKGRLQRGTIYPTGFFECRDGFVCIATQSPKHWGKFLEMMGNPDWAEADEHAKDALYLGAVDPTPADPHFRAWLGQLTRAEVMEKAMAAKIVLGAVNTVEEVLESEHLAQRDLWAEVEVGPTRARIPKAGYRLGGSPTAVTGGAPRLGDPARPRPAPVRTEAPTGGSARGSALEGVRVLDFGWNWAGPMAAQLLADMGADVIRVETTKRQDLMRFLDYTSYFFCHNNRSKRSVTINVTTPEGAQVVRDLARHVDVVMDNFSAGVMDKNGLGYEQLRQANPRIICVSMSMAGQTGPLRGMRGFASIATGFAGLERMVGYEDGTATGLMPFGLGDTTLAVQGALGALAALHHRERTGEGQFVDVSQIDSAVATMGEPLVDFQLNGRVAATQGNTHAFFAPHGIFACAGEEQWLALTVRDDREWQGLCRVVGRDDWAGDDGLSTAAGRRRRRADLEEGLAAWCRSQERDEAAASLADAGVPAAPLLGLDERDRHPHFTERGLVVQHTGGGFDPCAIYATPWALTATPPAMTRPAPPLGGDNDYVFRQLLGLDDAEIDKLTEAGALA